MLKKTIIASAVATTMATGLLVSGSAQAVQVNPDNFGQVLLAPMYNVLDGFTNVVRIVNTSQEYAVRAKVILRSAVHSRECLDFIIYLTPADVAEFTVQANPANQFLPLLTSSDDSLLSAYIQGGAPTFASQVPAQVPTHSADFLGGAYTFNNSGYLATGFDANGRPNGDHCAIGHIEVVAGFAIHGTMMTPSGVPITIQPGMTKGDLWRAFNPDINRATLDAMNPTNPTLDAVLPNADGTHGALVNIALMGSVDLKANASGDIITLPMTALVSSLAPSLVPGTPTPNVSYIINNRTYNPSPGSYTQIGSGFIFGTDNILDIERALSAVSVEAIYDNTPANLTNALVTFPTKYRHWDNTNYSRAFYDFMGRVYDSPFNPDGSIEYAVVSFDNYENGTITQGCIWSPCVTQSVYMTDEVNYIAGAYLGNFYKADRGWFAIEFPKVNKTASTMNPAAIGHTHRIFTNKSTTSAMARKRPHFVY